MQTFWRTYLLTGLFACLLLTACSKGSNQHLNEMKKQLDVEIGTIDKVSVLSTDGQEFPIDLDAFTGDLTQQGRDLQQSDTPIKREDVRYTVILYRKIEAPLVIEVGTQASQLANKTYRGNGAERFYRWIRDITGHSLFRAEIRNVEVTADDINQSISLSDGPTGEVWQILRTAEHVDAVEGKQYPLYPHYRLKLDTGNNVLEATILTPTLLAVKVGAETHYFRVNSELFSKLTQWLPLREKSADSFDTLFKASEIRIIPTGDKTVSMLERKLADSTFDQALSHELVRLLKRGIPASRDLSLPKQEKFKLVFVINGEDKEIRMYEQYFAMNGQNYAHLQLDRKILALVGAFQKRR